MNHTTSVALKGSIVALVTPMRRTGAIDCQAFEDLVEWHIAAGTHGLVVAGTTGESPVLSRREYARLLDAALSRAGGHIPVLAGTGSASTALAVAHSKMAAAAGASALLVVTPYYNRPPQRGLIAHFEAVADAVDVPVVLYNVPGRTGVDLEPDTALRLAEHPNIAAIKEAVPDLPRIRRLVTGGLPVLSGDDASALEAMRCGACGVISVAANVVPARFSRLCRLALAGDFERAGEIDREMRALYAFLGSDTNPIPVKWLLAQIGRIAPGLRLPLLELERGRHEHGLAVLEALRRMDADERNPEAV